MDPPHARRLLIVEDDRELLETLREFLAHPLIRIETALDGIEALKKVSRLKPQAILLDLAIPYVNGLQLFGQLLQDISRPKIIIMSAHAAAGVFDYARSIGALDCFEKPFDEGRLRACVHRALRIVTS